MLSAKVYGDLQTHDDVNSAPEGRDIALIKENLRSGIN